MHVRYGCALEFALTQASAVRCVIDIHSEQRNSLAEPDAVSASMAGRDSPFDISDVEADRFGNLVRTFEAGPGHVVLRGAGLVHHSGFPDFQDREAAAASVAELPPEARSFLLPTPRCASGELADHARLLFEPVASGWDRAQAICDYVAGKVRFDPALALVDQPAGDAFARRAGGSRDLAHLAILFCRAVGIPARLCLGYLGDGRASPPPAGSGFHAWMEAWLGHRWLTFDPTQHGPRVGRILVARGGDASDVPAVACDGPHRLLRFEVFAHEEEGARFPITARERMDHWEAMPRPAPGAATAGGTGD